MGPADVDLEAGVRRVRTLHCPPQVLLSAQQQQQQQQLPSAVVKIVKPSTSYCYSLLAYSSELQSLMKQLTLSQGEKLYIYFCYVNTFLLKLKKIFQNFIFQNKLN